MDIGQPAGDRPDGVTGWTRRGVLRLGGGLSMTALLAACGGGGGSGDGGSAAVPSASPPPAAAVPVPEPQSTAALPPSSQARSVLKRTSFGVHAETLAEIESSGVAAYLEHQLAYEAIDDLAVELAIPQRFPTTLLPAAAARLDFPSNRTTLVAELMGATLYRAYFSRRQLYEVMVEFWTNHFSIDIGNGLGPVLKPTDDRDVIRPHAMGSFRRLLQASARSPAMLFYLDNFLNTKSAPNENYARELLELHTLGVDGGYTEQDVKDVARCFTGWSLDLDTGLYRYVPEAHDTGAKTVLGQRIAAGGQESDGEVVLDLLASSSATARHIATKLCRRFIADRPPAATIDQVAQTYRQTDGDIRAMLRTLFATPAFLETRDGKIDRPIEYLGQIVRTLNPQLQMPDDNGWTYINYLYILGQLPFNWAAPNGYPDVAQHWASASGFLNRWRGALYAGGYDLKPLAGDATTIRALVDVLTASVLGRLLTAADRQALIDWLTGLTGLAADATLPSATLDGALPMLVAILISSAYFQLR